MEEISGGGDTTKNTMASLGILCEKDIEEQRLQIDSFIASPFQRSMDSVLARAKATAQSQVELANVKADLREAEDELVNVLAVKTRKEAKQMGLRDSISATQSRIQVVKRTLQLHKSNKEEHSKTISHRLQGILLALPIYFHASSLKSTQLVSILLVRDHMVLLLSSNEGLSVSKDNAGKVTGNKSNIDEAISWYNQALGFHVEAGHGVKFTFTNIDAKRPTREFSFTVHYGNDIYT
ncbi:hypothetical protein F2Q70_00011216, partial [Brassica cretica]